MNPDDLIALCDQALADGGHGVILVIPRVVKGKRARVLPGIMGEPLGPGGAGGRVPSGSTAVMIRQIRKLRAYAEAFKRGEA